MRTPLAVLGALLVSAPAAAGEFGAEAGVVSTYMFRGLDRSDRGAAVQGGLDYAFDGGLYTGLWISNTSAGGGNEADAYLGYGVEAGQFALDGGLIYYAFTEDTELGPNLDYAELFVGASIGPAALKVFFAPEFGFDQGGAASGDADRNELLYVTASANLTVDETVMLTPQLGFSAGDGVEDAFGDTYADYSLTATKTYADGFALSLAVVGTDRDLGPDNKDNPKFVLGLRKTFDL
jgi:uncharacterized protein (TIGR02001 family)